MNNEQAKSVDIIFNRGVRQDLDPHTAPPGSLVSCQNLEFDQLGRLVKRDGYGLLGTTALANGYVPQKQIRRIAQMPGGARLFLGDDAAFQYFPANDKVAQANLFGFFYRQHSTMTDVRGVAANNNGGILFSDTISVGTWVVYVYNESTNLGAGTAISVLADVVDITSGARVLTRVVLDTPTGANYPPRLVLSGGSSVVFALWEDGTGAIIRYSSIDLAGATLFWTAAANLVTNTGPAVFDADTMQSGWVLVYLNAATTLATLNTYDSSAAVTHTTTWKSNAGANNWAPSALAISGNSFNASSLVHAIGHDPATFTIECNTLSSALVNSAYARVDPGLDHAKPTRHIAVRHFATTTSVIAFSNYASNVVATNPRSNLNVYKLTDAGVLTSVTTLGNYCVASRFYMDSVSRGQSLQIMARFDDPSALQNHFALVSFGFNPSFETYPTIKEVQMHFASGRVPLKSENTVYGLGGIADMAAVNPGQFQFVGVANIGASQYSGNQVQAWTFQALDTKRYLSSQCQQALILGGGTPVAYDGQRFAELSFYSYPVLHSGNITPSAAGGSIAQGVYQYRAVYEWTDANGNRHQSSAAPAITVDLSSATYVAGTSSVALSLAAYEPTRKQGGSGVSDSNSPIEVVFYRTLAGGVIFYRVPGGAGNHSLLTTFSTFTDTYADASIAANEPIYTSQGGQGLLASTAPPPSIVLTTHAGRLWGVDCENPERIWCTRTLQPGSAPAYNPGLQILIPGAGRINGLAGQDGKLYALATNGIYLASYGDGPDDTGAGAFPSPQLITNTASCQDPRGVLVGQDGIFFTGTDQWGTGVYMIRRGDGQPISIGKRVRNELASYSVCRGVVNRVGKARTEFLFVDSDTSPTAGAILYYHHDYIDEEGIGQWTVAHVNADGAFASGVALECLGTWDDQSVVANESGSIGWQQSNVGIIKDFGSNFITTLIVTTDIRPAGLLGFAQVAGVSMLGTQSSDDPLKIDLSYDSGFSFPDTYQWTPSAESAGQPVIRRREPTVQKQFDGSTIRVRITNPTNGGFNPGATYFHGIAIEVAPLGGNARLDSARRS